MWISIKKNNGSYVVTIEFQNKYAVDSWTFTVDKAYIRHGRRKKKLNSKFYGKVRGFELKMIRKNIKTEDIMESQITIYPIEDFFEEIDLRGRRI